MHTIDIYGTMWGVGLWWQNLEPGEKPKKKIKSILQDFPEYNSYVIKSHDPRQVGFGKCSEPKIPRVSCLAPALVSSIPSESFIGWFRISDDTVWVVAVTENAILADVGDFLGTEEEAKEIFDDLEQLDDAPWQDDIYYYDNQDDAHDKLSSLVDQAFRTPKLKPTKIKVSKKFIILFCIIAVLAVGAHYGHNQYEHYKKQEKLRKQRIAFQKRQKKKEQQKKVDIEKLRKKYFPQKWIGSPYGGEVLSRCIQKIYDESLYDKEWRLKRVECDEKRVEVERNRLSTGNFVDLPDGYKINAQDPNTIIKSVKHGGKRPYKEQKNENLKSLEELSTHIYELARILKANVKLEVKSLNPKTVELGTETKIVNSPYDKGSFVLTVDNSCPNIDTDYIDHPGLLLTNVSYNHKNWIFKGKFYVRPK